MYRLFTYMALIRYVEFILIVLDFAYLGMLNPLNKFLIAILMTAIVYSLLAVASYSFIMNMWVTLILVLAIASADAALLILAVITPSVSTIGLYTACFINIILDVLVTITVIELIRR
ncbi:hypothetical protein [Vulcanisaeta distributa]|uniref:Uncharacterized protein n=1 Tax=Vulcanisaeta distributa (strain DSM 14429 / JCM 11212 / NBRC 100878 / IC-017) TaxID=572478 RepID=E1QPB6_VULDI|nr:hypothetical protein [Vulcanisaeta distributa]ADN50287.1 hypothetical protein Vdis_0897 [Vulcanisaeta distributa DSM 14429]